MDYGKYKYETSKKTKASKAKQHIIKVKEIKFHPKTGENDYNYRLVQGKEFLEKGFKVKATVVFRGREMAHLDYGRRWLTKMTEDLQGFGVAEGNSVQEGRNMTMIFAPDKNLVKAKKPEDKGEKPANAPGKDADTGSPEMQVSRAGEKSED